MTALQIKNLPTGAGDDIKIDASYAVGTTKNVISTSGTSPSFAMFGSSGLGYQSVGLGATSDALYAAPGTFGGGPLGGSGSGLLLTKAWGVRGAFNHNWDAYWSSSIFGSYSSIRYDGGADDNLRGRSGHLLQRRCGTHGGVPTQTGVAGVGTYSCNPDFNISQLGVVTRWTPV